MELDPLALKVEDRYKLLIGCIVPRPIAFVSTISTDGRLNLAPFSFFAGVGSDPMTVLFCPANKPDGSEKDSLRNAKPVAQGGVGEFVINVATEDYERQMAAAAEPLPHGESEFELAGLHTAPSRVVKPPRVAESPVSFECRTMQVIRTNPGVAAGGNIVVGQVVHIFVRDDLINERFHTDPAKLRAVGRMGGTGYVRTGDAAHRFEMPMGKQALEPGAERRANPPAIRLRPTRSSDLPALFEIQCDPESNEMAGTKPRTREVFFSVWEGHFANPNINSRVIELDGQIIGSIACFQADGHDCVGYWIARAHWGKGVAGRALELFLTEERRRPLHATAARANAPSRCILEKRGFRCTGFRIGEETDRFVAREIADYVLD